MTYFGRHVGELWNSAAVSSRSAGVISVGSWSVVGVVGHAPPCLTNLSLDKIRYQE